MDKLLKQMGNQIQKELIAKLITASQDGDFDKDTFFTEDHLQALFNDTAADMTKTQKQAAKKAKKAKKTKDPNQPSRTNTWMCYCEERRPEIKAANTAASFKDIAQMLVQSRQRFPLNILRHAPLRLRNTPSNRSQRIRVPTNTDRITNRILKTVRLPKAPNRFRYRLLTGFVVLVGLS